MSFLHDLKIAARSLSRVRALWITVALTLALGIGANAAIFSVVRAVLLRPLANRDEDRLLYVRQSAPGIGETNATFSVPEIRDIGSSLKTIQELGTFSEIDFTVVGLGTPREIPAGVVDGHYFEVMGLRPILGRLLGPSDDGPNAAGAIVLTYHFWRTSLQSDPSVLGKQVRLESVTGRAFGDSGRRAGTFCPVSRGDGDYRQRGHQPSSSFRNDGDGPRTSHDRGLCAACSGSDGGRRESGTAHRIWRDDGCAS